MPQLTRPKALLIDYGGTLVDELGYDPPAGVEMLLSRAVVRPAGASFDAVMQRVRSSTSGERRSPPERNPAPAPRSTPFTSGEFLRRSLATRRSGRTRFATSWTAMA